jgi:DNA polymerase-4
MADVPSRIWPLPARKINGIGPKAGERLDRLGIHTVGELAAADEELLIRPDDGQLAASGGAGHR